MLLLACLLSAPPSEFASVQAIFAKNCVSCHGPSKHKSGLRLDRKSDAMKGGDSGVAFKPKDANASLLVELVSGRDPDRVMPPTGKRLSTDEVATIKAWIDAGAYWPDDGSPSVDPKKWWAFQPIEKKHVPLMAAN